MLLHEVLALIKCSLDDFDRRLAELALSREDCVRLINDGTASFDDAYGRLADTVLDTVRDRH